MPKLSAKTHQVLNANIEAFFQDVEALKEKHNLANLNIEKIHFTAGGLGPQGPPCVPPNKLRRVCTPSGVCRWVCS